MTENDAKDKICPIRSEVCLHSRCVASKCMMWRWHYDTAGKQTDEGFCGLAPIAAPYLPKEEA